MTTSCPNYRMFPVEPCHLPPTSPLDPRSVKCLGVCPRSRRVERSRRTSGQHPAARVGMLSRERGTSITWMELPIQQHASFVHFRHTRGQSYYTEEAVIGWLHSDTLRRSPGFATYGSFSSSCKNGPFDFKEMLRLDSRTNITLPLDRRTNLILGRRCGSST